MMKRTMACVLGLGCALALAAAADETKTAGHGAGGATKHVTGCLEKGDDANTFKLTHVTGGAVWKLSGAAETLKMADHLGHKVQVTGTALTHAPGEDEKGVTSGSGRGANVAVEKKESSDEKGVSSGTGSGAKDTKDAKADHQLKVTALKHVAPTCP